MSKLALIWLGLGVTTAVFAQTPTPAPDQTEAPAEPFLERAPDFARWTITSKPSSNPEAGNKPASDLEPEKSPAPEHSPEPPANSSKSSRHRKEASAETSPEHADFLERVTTVTKTKSIRLEETTGSGSDDIQRWCFPGIQVTVRGSSSPVVSLPGSSMGSTYLDYSTSDFEGFQWLSSRNFKDVEMVNEQECFVFHDKTRGDNGNKPVSETMAAINTATRLPVLLQFGEESHTFHFDVAPTAMLTPPPAVMVTVEQWQKSMQQSSLMPAKP